MSGFSALSQSRMIDRCARIELALNVAIFKRLILFELAGEAAAAAIENGDHKSQKTDDDDGGAHFQGKAADGEGGDKNAD